MRNTFLQALATYTMPWRMRWITLLGLLALLALCAIAVAGRRGYSMDTGLVLPLTGATVMVFGAAIGAHMKEQFAHSRARLIPNFVKPHLLAGAFVCLFCCVIPTFITAWGYRLSVTNLLVMFLLQSTGMVGVTAEKSWRAGSISFQAGSISFALWTLTLGPMSSRPIMALTHGEYPIATAIGIFLCAGIWVCICRYLVTVTESDRAYHRQWELNRPQNTADLWRQRAPETTWSGRLSLHQRDRLTERAMRNVSPTLESQLRRLRLPTAQCWTPWLMVAAAAGYMVVMRLVFGQTDVPSALFAIFVVMAGFARAGAWRQRPTMSEREQLLPMNRPTLVRRLMTAMCLDIGTTLVITVIALGVVLALLGVNPWGRASNPLILLMVLLIMTVLYLTTILWLMPSRSNTVWWIGQLVAIYGMMLALLFSRDQMRSRFAPLSDNQWIVAGGILLLCSVLVGASAYRRWMRAEWR